VLVLNPPRELSGQILDSFGTCGRHVGMSTTLAIAGIPVRVDDPVRRALCAPLALGPHY
jgi:hypothetical protein